MRLESSAKYEDKLETLLELLVEIDGFNAIRGTWMEHRWRSAKARICGEKTSLEK